MHGNLTSDQLKQLAKAKRLLQDESWSPASTILEKLYQDCENIEIGHLLVEALYMDKQYKLAQQYANEHQDSYLATESLYRLMVSLLLRNHQFIIARQFALLSPKKEWHSRAQANIENQEKSDLEKLGATIKTITRQFYHLGDEEFIEQKRRFELAYQLPLEQYVMGAKFLLRDPFTNPLIRSSILQVLQRLKFNAIIKLYWLDHQEHKIDCATLRPMNEIEPVVTVSTQFENLLGQSDPITLQILEQEFQLQMAFCYPLIEQVVTDAKLWAQIAVARMAGKTVTENKVTGEIIKWQVKLTALNEKLLQNIEK